MASRTPKKENKLPIPEGLRMLTQALFFEWKDNTSSKIQPPFCLKPYDWENNGNHYKSMYLLFMSYDTEYEAAIGILGSWPHWQKLCKAKWFQKYVNEWREEMRLRDESLAKSKLIRNTKEGNVTAAKALLAEAKGTTGKPGRPSKKTQQEQNSRTPQSDDLDNLLASADKAKRE